MVARSSAEVEYRAMTKAFTKLIWVKMLLEELGLKVNTPMKLWCDNTAAIHIANNHVFHERTKHIEVNCHYIGDKVKESVIDELQAKLCSDISCS